MTDKPMLNGLTEAETSATASCAGLSVGEALPVAAWRADDHSSPHVALTRKGLGLLGNRYGYPLTPRAPAQATIERLTRERDEAGRQMGVACTAQLYLQRELDELKAKQVADIDEVLAAGALMANTMFNLAQQTHKFDDYHRKLFKSMQVRWDAAREALRTALTPKEPS